MDSIFNLVFGCRGPFRQEVACNQFITVLTRAMVTFTTVGIFKVTGLPNFDLVGPHRYRENMKTHKNVSASLGNVGKCSKKNNKPTVNVSARGNNSR